MNLLQVNLKETFYDAKHEITIILSVLDRMVKVMVRFINKQKSKSTIKMTKYTILTKRTKLTNIIEMMVCGLLTRINFGIIIQSTCNKNIKK